MIQAMLEVWPRIFAAAAAIDLLTYAAIGLFVWHRSRR